MEKKVDGKRRKKMAVLFVLPSAIVMIAFIVVPIIYGFYISLQKICWIEKLYICFC